MTKEQLDQFRRLQAEAAEREDQVNADVPSFEDGLPKVIVPATEFVNLPGNDRPRLLGKWLREEDMGMIIAPRGVGKTLLTLPLVRAVAAGESFGPWFADRKPARVLYVDGEMHQPDFQKRIRQLGPIPEDLHILSHQVFYETFGFGPNLSLVELREALTVILKEKEIKLVVLDNLSTLISGVQENDSFEWEQIQAWLLELRRMKVAVIIIHHTGRNLEARGTSKREDPLNWMIKLSPADPPKNLKDADDDTFIQSEFTKIRGEPEPIRQWHFHLNKDDAQALWEIQTYEPEDSRDQTDALVALVNDGYSSTSEIAAELELSKGYVSKLATRAEKAGLIRKGKKNEYLPVMAAGHVMAQAIAANRSKNGTEVA